MVRLSGNIVGWVLLLAGLAVGLRECNGATSEVGPTEQARVFGGQPDPGQKTDGFCEKTNIDCPDPNGLTPTCGYNAATSDCIMCQMNVASWQSCVDAKGQPNRDCTQKTDSNSKWCGTRQRSVATGTTCPNPCNMNVVGIQDCGKQIPSIMSNGSCPP